MNRKDIEKLYNEGLITEDQKDVFTARIAEESSWTLRSRMISVLTVSAVVLICVGVCMLLGAYWGVLTMEMKTGIGMGFLAVVWVIWLMLKDKSTYTAEALSCIGAMLWLGNIIFQQQFFQNVTGDAILLFFAGIAVIPFVCRLRLLYIIVAGVSYLSLLVVMGDKSATFSLYKLTADHSGTVWALIFPLFSFWWLMGERARDLRQNVVVAHYLVGMPSFFILLISATTLLIARPMDMSLYPHTWLIFAATPLLYLALKPHSAGWASWLLLSACLCSLLPLATFLAWHKNLGMIPGSIISWVSAIVLMFTGLRCRNLLWINCGALLAAFVSIFVVSNAVQSLNDSGLALIIIGVSALGFTFLLELQRRRLARLIHSQLPPIPKADDDK